MTQPDKTYIKITEDLNTADVAETLMVVLFGGPEPSTSPDGPISER